jgi:tetratricopeptide (TPR) repeat protein/transcriptional regulator with XRE-family HTH domain
MNEKLRLARIQRHLSELDVCSAIGCDLKTYVNWELGKHIPQAFWRGKLCDFFGMSLAELGYDPVTLLARSFPSPSVAQQDATIVSESAPDDSGGQEMLPASAQSSIVQLTPEHVAILLSLIQWFEGSSMTHDPQKRKTLQQLAFALGSLAAVPATSSSLFEGFSALAEAPMSSISSVTLDRLDKMVMLCWRLLRGNELKTVEYLLDTLLPETEALAHQPSSYQKQIAGFAAQAQIIKSLVVGHRDDLQAKLAACQAAIGYSRLAENPNFEATALIQQAVALDYRKHYEKSFEVYQQAAVNLSSISPLLQARVLAGLGGAYARNGQQEYEARAHLEQARETMPGEPEADPSFLYADCGQYTLPLWEGRIYFELDQYEQAFSVFSRVEMQTDIPERIRTEFLNHMLETSIVQGDLDQSLFHLRQAGMAAVNLNSDRRQREVQEAGQMMLSIWRQERKQIREVMTEVFAK